MFWCFVRLSAGALSGGLYANSLKMAIQSAVACSEANDGGLLVSWLTIPRDRSFCLLKPENSGLTFYHHIPF